MSLATDWRFIDSQGCSNLCLVEVLLNGLPLKALVNPSPAACRQPRFRLLVCNGSLVAGVSPGRGYLHLFLLVFLHLLFFFFLIDP